MQALSDKIEQIKRTFDGLKINCSINYIHTFICLRVIDSFLLNMCYKNKCFTCDFVSIGCLVLLFEGKLGNCKNVRITGGQCFRCIDASDSENDEGFDENDSYDGSKYLEALIVNNLDFSKV
jgi:hypothetical protein